MKYDLFFKLAKEAGIEECELSISSGHSLSFSLFHGEVDNYSEDESFVISARGKINGKMGTASCDVWNKDKVKFLVNEIVNNAKVIESTDPTFIFKGSEKYHKTSTFNKNLEKISIDEKMAKLRQLETNLKNYDKRIIEVEEVSYDECFSTHTLMNSHGLKLSQKLNYFVYGGAVIAKNGDQTKSGGDLFLANDFTKFDTNDLTKKICDQTLRKLDGEPCKSDAYPAVLDADVVKSLLIPYIGHSEAEEVQKNSSLFKDKINQKIASSKVTILDMPLAKTIFSRWFDDEGVACYNKPIIKKGVLQTYLYNLTTAAKDNVQSTGNGAKTGGKIGTTSALLVMKPGKTSLEDLLKKVNNGVYITEVSGLHAGLNAQSGNFSLQATGYRVENGKIGKGLDIITVSGNLLDIFKNVITVGSDAKLFLSGVVCPSVQVKSIKVGGK